jgi:hypothetical protein
LRDIKRNRAGKPINDDVIAEGRRELRLDEIHAAEEKKREPNRDAIVASMPQGKLSETDVPKEKIPEAIAALTDARKVLIHNLGGLRGSSKVAFEVFNDSEHSTFGMLAEEIEKGALGDEQVKNAVESIRSYMTIDLGTTLSELPELIRNFLFELEHKQ